MKKDTPRKFRLDPDRPPRLSPAEQARLDAMTEEEVETAARTDPDARPVPAARLPAFKRS